MRHDCSLLHSLAAVLLLGLWSYRQQTQVWTCAMWASVMLTDIAAHIISGACMIVAIRRKPSLLHCLAAAMLSQPGLKPLAVQQMQEQLEPSWQMHLLAN